MDYLLDKDIYTNDVEYFFSLHGPRFEYMNTAMAVSLSKRFGKEFRPIRVLNAWPGKHYDVANYIILNERSYKLMKELGKPVVYLPDYEDVNVEFAQNKTIQKISAKLLKKQETIYVYPFTTSFLDLPSDYTVLGPDSKLAKVYDNKINQLKLFKKLGLPHNTARIFDNKDTLLERANEIVPCYLSAAYTSGGNESGLIYDRQMLHEFLTHIRPVNKKNHFIVSDIFENIVLAPNVNAFINQEGTVYILVISDQILQGNRYLGNLYPSIAKKQHIKQIYGITKTIGNYLANKGYRGLFGCDFLINRRGDLVVVDLNPRHQGGYVCNTLALEHKSISITDIELATHHNEIVKLSQSKLDAELGFAWSHSKLLPAEKGQEVHDEYYHNTIELPFTKIGESFAAEFYKKGSVYIEGYIGYQVQTDKSRGQLETKMLHVKERFDSQVLGL
ncbi:MAG TPA: ATP-grasp domain-containing protein [Candidatus Saccharimonadales bacterium]|nr:ATP-grasp domain-containing protein [Candidatus Saccharimonadales bacterium]